MSYVGTCTSPHCAAHAGLTLCNMGFGTHRRNEDMVRRRIVCSAYSAPFHPQCIYFLQSFAKIEYCLTGENELRSITFWDNREQVARQFGRSGSLAWYTMLVVEVHQPSRFKFDATKDPRTIRYSQAHISRHFRGGRSIEDTVRQLSGRQVSVCDIEPIRLFEHDGQWHSLDNRRLCASKTAQCPKVPVVYVSVTGAEFHREFNRKFSTTDGGLSIQFLD